MHYRKLGLLGRTTTTKILLKKNKKKKISFTNPGVNITRDHKNHF